MNIDIRAPWLDFYGEVPATLDYPDISMVELMEQTAKKYPNLIAMEFLGSKTTYSQFVKQVHQCAKALKVMGIEKEQRVTICMPNCPQALIMFYAVNLIGAIANMIHPLSSEGEIEFYVNASHSVAAITLDQFYGKFEAIRANTPELKALIITSVKDAVGAVMKVGYSMTEGRKVKKLPKDAPVTMWNKLMRMGDTYTGQYRLQRGAMDPAVILYSGGTTGTTKGILLSNLNFNALSMQTAASGNCIIPGHAMLAIMPVFHGFGLGVCIHTMLTNACKCILVPKFTAQTYATLLKKNRPNYIAGVPTLYEALLRNDKLDGVDLSCLEGVFSGGDSLSIELKKKVDIFLKEHNASVQIREGYGTTECVTASCLTPKDFAKEGSIGIPFPDTFYKIVKPGTTEELPFDTEGEICLSGPSVMIEYMDQPEETANTLRTHDDGRIWLHTGDLGIMDKEGFIYFKQRLKRMIVSSGYSIYPSQLENIIEAHEHVLISCVIGVDDLYKIQKVKAFVVLKPNVLLTDAVKEDIMNHCRRNIAKYSMPYEIEYRKELPKTLVGKVAYKILEEEERSKGIRAKTDENAKSTVGIA